MAESVTALHLSDIQFGRNHRFGRFAANSSEQVNFETLIKRIAEDLTFLKEYRLRPDIIIISGDLAETGMKAEFDDCYDFLVALCRILQMPAERVIIIPGNHDINRKSCEGYFATCEGDGDIPKEPYWPKWKSYVAFFRKFYAGRPAINFTESEPWTYYSMPELKVAVAGLNSTLRESHQPDSHYGFVGEGQLRWFVNKLDQAKNDQWLRIGVVHHNILRGAVDDDENLRDKDDLQRILQPSINLFLHGHTHEGKSEWLDPKTPVFSTGSAALKKEQRPDEVGNQYQVLRIRREGVDRWLRRYDPINKRWIGDTRLSKNGDTWIVTDEVQFEGVDAALSVDTKLCSTLVEPATTTAIINIERPLTPEEAESRLIDIPRLTLRVVDHHKAVRREAQESMVEMLKSVQAVWVIADWGQGKEGFLACALDRFGGPSTLANTFRLQCGGITSCEELFACAETQLGLSFQEFLAAVAALPTATLVLDDIPHQILVGAEREILERRLKPVLDFCPKLKVVLIGRQRPRLLGSEKIVELLSLDLTEVRDYLRYHARATQGLDNHDCIDQITTWSGGLPMHLDRLLDRIPYVTLSEILSEELISSVSTLTEPIPEGLKATVKQLMGGTDKVHKRSLRLLKVLTVLRDGETYLSIRRFNQAEPFYQDDIDLLVSYALIESVQITQTAPELSLRNVGLGEKIDAPRLLRVPRQVRDYVSSLMTDDERDEIASASMSLFFGDKWWKGKVRLRTTIANAYGQSAIGGPGNEHVIARLILAKAIDKGNLQLSKKYAQLALAYCSRLVNTDRFRDAAIAAKAVLDLLKPTALKREYYEAAYIHGRSQRMIGRVDDAIQILEIARSGERKFVTDDLREEILLNLAFCYKFKDDTRNCEKSLAEVLKNAHPDSGTAMQAEAIKAQLTLKGEKLKERLVELEQKARNRAYRGVANNISLDLASHNADPEAAVQWLNKVIHSERDSYNRSRAIVEKATVLAKHISMSQLTDEEHRMLGAAYSYSYAQRMGNLLDRCHGALWQMGQREKSPGILLRLFRFSSLIWRLRGEDEQERKYLDQLSGINLKGFAANESGGLKFEIYYFEGRLAEAKNVTPGKT